VVVCLYKDAEFTVNGEEAIICKVESWFVGKFSVDISLDGLNKHA
jgi:hypothetical protein